MDAEKTRREDTGHSTLIISHLAQLQRNSRTHLESAGPVVVSATNVFVVNNGEVGTRLLSSFEILRYLDISGDERTADSTAPALMINTNSQLLKL